MRKAISFQGDGMITGYSLCDGKLIPAQDIHDALWLDISVITNSICTVLKDRYNIPRDFLYPAFDPSEHPQVQQHGAVTLILVRASQGEEVDNRLPFGTSPVAIIVTPEVLVTVCPKPGLVRTTFQAPVSTTGMRHPVALALQLLLRISKTFINHLHLIDERTEAIENEMNKSMQNKGLIQLLHIEKSLIYFQTSLKANKTIVEKIIHDDVLCCSTTEHSLLGAVLIENKQAVDMAEVFSQILGSIGDTFGTIVSNNVNKAMKFLTGMTIILMIPTIVCGAYGMNVPLPYQNHQFAFIALAVICVIISGFVWRYFWKKDWM